ncbi:MAG: transglutaminase domain-containing protein [Candidatus Saccharimonadia bacterium]
MNSRAKPARLALAILLILADTCFSLVPALTAASADFSYVTSVNYHVNENGSTNVTENYSVTDNTPLSYLSGIKITTPTDSISGLVVSYSDGSPIPATSQSVPQSQGQLRFSAQEIDIVFPKQIYGMGRQWGFSVAYVSQGLVDTKGSAHTIYVPSIADSAATDSYTVTVDVPADFGNPHFANAVTASQGVANGRQTYLFSKDELSSSALSLAFGDATIYSLNFNFPLVNDSNFGETLSVTLPPDLNNQKSYVNSLSPTPADTRLDTDGNVLADYHVAAHQHVTVVTNISGQVNYLEYNLSASGTKNDIPAALVHDYTSATTYWPTSGSVAAATRSVTDPNAPVINNVKAIYDFVIAKLTYNPQKIKFNIRQGATKALANPTNAVCLEYADLTIAMLRSAGIPAREAIGYAYSGSLKNSPAVDDSLHAWVEAYVPGIGWMTLDPTWGVKFDEFGKSDLDHFAFAVWGENDSAPTAVMNGGTDENYQYENAVLSYLSKVSIVPATGAISATHYVIAPWLRLDRYSVTAEAQTASDGNLITVSGKTIVLGSLAPSQHLYYDAFVWGGGWNSRTQIGFSRSVNGSLIILASGYISPNYLPMLLLILFIIFVSTLVIVLRLRSRRRVISSAATRPPT